MAQEKTYDTNAFLIALLKDLNWSYKRFALEVDTCQHQVSKWCNNSIEMRFSTLKALMAKLKIELEIKANYEGEE